MDQLKNNKDSGDFRKESVPPWIKSVVFYLIFIILLGTAIYFHCDFFLDVMRSIGEIPIWLFVFVCLSGCLYRIIDGDLLYRLGRRYQPDLKRGQGIACAFSGAFFQVTTLGSGMGISKIYYLTRLGIPAANSTGICLIQYILDRTAIFLYGFAAYLMFPTLRTAIHPYRFFGILGIVICLFTIGVLILVATSSQLSARLLSVVRRICKNHPKWLSKIDRMEEQICLLQVETALVFRDKKLTVQLIFECLLMQTSWYVIPYLAMQGKGPNLLTSIAFISAARMLAGSVPLPSGYGSLDIIFIVLLSGIVETALATSTMVLFRFATTFVPFFVGAVIVFLWRKRSVAS
jgi:uncharacterized membrane protein YbhN (UPF0104 family)